MSIAPVASVTDGEVPSLHVDYNNSRIKQYHKEAGTQTTV